MFYDRRGIPVTAQNQTTVTRWDQTVSHFLSHCNTTAETLEQTLQEDGDFVLGHVAKGLFAGLMAQDSYTPIIRESLTAAQRALTERGGTQREQDYVGVLGHWYAGEWRKASDLLEQISVTYPLDAFAVKMTHNTNFMLGANTRMHHAIETVIPAWQEDIPDCGYIFGCHAFSLEETGAYEAAEHVGRQAIDLAPDDAWGLHAITHVKEMKGRPNEGILFLKEHKTQWKHCNNFRYHMYWHWALFYLELDQQEAALDLYDQFIWQKPTDDFRDLSNAASLLWRIEAEGIDVGMRWHQLATIARKHIDDHTFMFADAHYLLCLACSGQIEEARTFLTSLHHVIDTSHNTIDQHCVARRIGIPLLEGILALIMGTPDQAVARIGPIRHQLQEIGGSHAQRDVFIRLLIDAALACENYEMVQTVLKERACVRCSTSHWAEKRLRHLKQRQKAKKQ